MRTLLELPKFVSQEFYRNQANCSKSEGIHMANVWVDGVCGSENLDYGLEFINYRCTGDGKIVKRFYGKPLCEAKQVWENTTILADAKCVAAAGDYDSDYTTWACWSESGYDDGNKKDDQSKSGAPMRDIFRVISGGFIIAVTAAAFAF